VLDLVWCKNVLFTNPQRKPRKKTTPLSVPDARVMNQYGLADSCEIRVGKLQVEDFDVRFGVSNNWGI